MARLVTTTTPAAVAAAWEAEMRHTRALGIDFPAHEALWVHRRALVALWVHRVQPSCVVRPTSLPFAPLAHPQLTLVAAAQVTRRASRVRRIAKLVVRRRSLRAAQV